MPTSAQASEEYIWDVFISYSHKNSRWVWEWLTPRLKAVGLKVCIDKDCFEPGEPSLTAMERGVLKSRKTLLILTLEYVNSEWSEFENVLAQTLDPSARKRRIVPLLLAPTEIPPRIRMLTHLDFTLVDQREDQLKRLISTIESNVSIKRKTLNTMRLVVQPLEEGEVVKFSDFTRGKFNPVSPFEYWFKASVPLTDAITNMWKICRAIDPECQRFVIEPADWLFKYFKVEFRSKTFIVSAEFKLVKLITLKLVLAVRRASMINDRANVIFTVESYSPKVPKQIIEKFKQTWPPDRILQEEGQLV